MKANQKIDFIITWLDNTDPKWQKTKAKYQVAKKSDANSSNRYRNWDTLKFWFRTVEKYAPWVNKIYFVTCGQTPSWLNVDNPKIVLVNHKDYIPKEYLPTFNSNVIELFFHKIPSLSEYSVYFNDDMFINAPVRPSDFFQNNLPNDSFVFNAISAKPDSRIIEHTILNNLELLSRDFTKSQVLKKHHSKIYNYKYGKSLLKTILLWPWKNFTGIENPHIAQPFLKSSYSKVWKLYGDDLSSTGSNKFRTKNDYSWWIVRYFQLFTGKFAPYPPNNYAYYDLDNNNKPLFSDIINHNHKLICINDSDPNLNYHKIKTDLLSVLEEQYPDKSTFEKEDK